jgi:hypothetical protein
VVPVKHVDPPRHDIPRTNWQRLGQLKLKAGSNLDGTIKSWFMNTLRDFSLPGDLVSRLLASMEEAKARVLRSHSIETQFEYLEIAILAPAEETSKGHTWGFFRVEREAIDSQIESVKGYCVEYYLYLDRKTGQYV